MIINKKWIGVLLTGVLVSGCNVGGDAQKTVADNAQQRWDSLLAGDLKSAYQFYTEDYQKQVSYENFPKNLRGIGLWSKAEVQNVTCSEQDQTCKVNVKVTAAMKMRGISKLVETHDVITETWVKSGQFSDWRYIKN